MSDPGHAVLARGQHFEPDPQDYHAVLARGQDLEPDPQDYHAVLARKH